jgi:hypothetical protein
LYCCLIKPSLEFYQAVVEAAVEVEAVVEVEAAVEEAEAVVEAVRKCCNFIQHLVLIGLC